MHATLTTCCGAAKQDCLPTCPLRPILPHLYALCRLRQLGLQGRKGQGGTGIIRLVLTDLCMHVAAVDMSVAHTAAMAAPNQPQ